MMTYTWERVKKVLYLYAKRGFVVTLARMDRDFEAVKKLCPLLEINTPVAREHVGEIERRIQVVKERTRAISSEFPFRFKPILVPIHVVYNVIL